MQNVPISEHLFYIFALFSVGIWSIVSLGAKGFTPEGVPCLPPRVARGTIGRIVGSTLVLIGVIFVALALGGCWRLWERLAG